MALNANQSLDVNLAQSIDVLRKRFEALNAEKIRAETNLGNSTKALEALKKEAREKYGTDDLARLRARLDEMTRENERKRAEYQAHLTEIETKLAEVEARHAEAAGTGHEA